MEANVRLSEIVAAATDAIGSDFHDPGSSRARELTARAGWRWDWVSWEDLIERIAQNRFPEPGLRHVLDDYGD